MKFKTLALIVSAFFISNSYAVQHINSEQYQKLLPKDENGQVNYDLKLADKIDVQYHCDLKSENGELVLDRNNCEKTPFNIDWKKNYPDTVNLNLYKDPSNKTIEEHKLWAMAFAQAYVSSMVEMQYGLNKKDGTFDLSQPFGTGESFGEYFARNLGPNYYLSKGLQESSLGKDIPELQDDGVLQVEYKVGSDNSAWGGLKGSGEGGFPLVFTKLDPLKVLHSKHGVARNIVGSALTSSYYNGMALGITSGSIKAYDQTTADSLSINKMNKFLQQAKSKDGLAIVMGFMYNRGAYAAKDQVLKNNEVFDHCASVVDKLASDVTCFNQANDPGSRYMRQIPDVNHTLLAAAADESTSYDVELTRDDISNYLDLIQRYGFYSKEDIAKAKVHVLAKFDQIAAKQVISYRHDFGKILEVMMVNLPVAEFAEKAPIDMSKKSTLTNVGDMVFLSVKGVDNYYSWLNPGQTVPVDADSKITQLYLAGGKATDVACAAVVQSELAAVTADKPAHLSLSLSGGQCQIDSNYVKPDDKVQPVKDLKKCSSYSEWKADSDYNPPAKVVLNKTIYNLKWGTVHDQNNPSANDWKGGMWENKGTCN